MRFRLGVMLLGLGLVCGAFASAAVADEEVQSEADRWVAVATHWQNADRPDPQAVRSVEILGPKSTCFGRFSDSLRDYVLRPHPWVHSVKLERTFEQTGASPFWGGNVLTSAGESQSFSIGSPTRITIVVNREVSDREVFEMLLETRRYDVKSWRVVREVTIGSLLEEAGSR